MIMASTLPSWVERSSSLVNEDGALKAEDASTGFSSADTQSESDDDMFSRKPRQEDSQQGFSWSYHSTEPLGCEIPPQPAPRGEPAKVSLSLSLNLAISAEQQVTAAAALPLARTRLLAAAKPYRPRVAPDVAPMVPPLGTQAAIALLETPPGPKEIPLPLGICRVLTVIEAPPGRKEMSKPVDSRLVPIASGKLPAPDDESRDFLWLDEAVRKASPQRRPRRKRGQPSRQSDKTQVMAGVCEAVRAAINQTEGVWSVATYKDANETSYVVQVIPGHQQAADAALHAAKAGVMNASAVAMNTYVIGFMSQPFQEFSGGFTAVVGFVPSWEEVDTCWTLYETGKCPCWWTCRRQHPQKKHTERISVKIIV